MSLGSLGGGGGGAGVAEVELALGEVEGDAAAGEDVEADHAVDAKLVGALALLEVAVGALEVLGGQQGLDVEAVDLDDRGLAAADRRGADAGEGVGAAGGGEVDALHAGVDEVEALGVVHGGEDVDEVGLVQPQLGAGALAVVVEGLLALAAGLHEGELLGGQVVGDLELLEDADAEDGGGGLTAAGHLREGLAGEDVDGDAADGDAADLDAIDLGVADLALLADRGARADRELELGGELGIDDDVGGAGVEHGHDLLAGDLDLDHGGADVAGDREVDLAGGAGDLQRLADEGAVAAGEAGVVGAEGVEGLGDAEEVALMAADPRELSGDQLRLDAGLFGAREGGLGLLEATGHDLLTAEDPQGLGLFGVELEGGLGGLGGLVEVGGGPGDAGEADLGVVVLGGGGGGLAQLLELGQQGVLAALGDGDLGDGEDARVERGMVDALGGEDDLLSARADLIQEMDLVRDLDAVDDAVVVVDDPLAQDLLGGLVLEHLFAQEAGGAVKPQGLGLGGGALDGPADAVEGGRLTGVVGGAGRLEGHLDAALVGVEVPMQGGVLAGDRGLLGVLEDEDAAAQLPALLAVVALLVDLIVEVGAPIHPGISGGLEGEAADFLVAPAVGVGFRAAALGQESHARVDGALGELAQGGLASERGDVVVQNLPGGLGRGLLAARFVGAVGGDLEATGEGEDEGGGADEAGRERDGAGRGTSKGPEHGGGECRRGGRGSSSAANQRTFGAGGEETRRVAPGQAKY